ncbi:MAG: hypothetical protein ACPLSA_00570 [Caldanaerobacter sp.]
MDLICLLLDSQNIDKEKQLKLNNLEDEDNEIRAIFAVRMLDEGWDVLNLFDIVRLYNTRDGEWTKDGEYKPGSTTISEKQLIGRGARYFPFKVKPEDDPFRRKYDKDLENELRILEILHYHSYNDSKYITEIKYTLTKSGLMANQQEEKEVEIKVKPNIKETKFWENGLIYINEVKEQENTITDLLKILKDKTYKCRLHAMTAGEVKVFEEEENKDNNNIEIKSVNRNLSDFGETIIRKAINKIEFYKFNNIKRIIPTIKSSNELIEILKLVNVEIQSSKEVIDNLTSDDKLKICINVLEQIETDIIDNLKIKHGTRTFYGHKVKEIVKDKKIKIKMDASSDREYGKPMSDPRESNISMDIKSKDWYIYDENYGTSEEKCFVKFIDGMIDELKEKYEEVYLLRNENLFRIYNFDDGQAMEPDFVLFLKRKDAVDYEQYQLFIEAKGDHLIKNDQWKEEFLLKIEAEHQIETTIFKEDEKYKIIGMPFYNENQKARFKEIFKEKLLH